ncbi:single-stranded-DNA-specific exonuclease RecJ [soil metagenome]
MPTVTKQWHLRPHDADGIQRLATAAKLSPVVSQLLLNRGVSEPELAKRYLDANLGGLHPPQSLPGVPEAAERIWKAIRDKEKICIFGDYDADGVTGTAILVSLIERLGGSAEFYIPHRMEEGYGLNSEALRLRQGDGVTLVVTVDCGITAIPEAEEAKRLGLDLIITDHHEMKDLLPDAFAIVHPAKPGSTYPFAGLSGSGVALKLAWAIAQLASSNERVTPDLREFLLDAVGLAALGLVADVVPLRDENRILVRHGLPRIMSSPSIGLKALIETCSLSSSTLRSEDVSFRIAPRLNAAGRLDCALLVVELLTTRSPTRARELAGILENYNQQRQQIERRITNQAKELVEANGWHDAPAIVLGSAEWHVGVVGIVAGRLVEQYGRPVVLVAVREGDALSTGSGRSIPGIELHHALKHCDGILERYGGHAMAAGVRVIPSRIPAFRDKLCEYAAGVYNGVAPIPKLMIDAEVPIALITFNLMKEIDKLEPYGAENPRPKLLATGLTVEGVPRKVGQGERHLNLKVRQGNTSMKAVAFGMGDRFDELAVPGVKFSAVFTPRINEWQGYKSVQMEILDFRIGESVELV